VLESLDEIIPECSSSCLPWGMLTRGDVVTCSSTWSSVIAF
jgi:hypothetical protein